MCAAQSSPVMRNRRHCPPGQVLTGILQPDTLLQRGTIQIAPNITMHLSPYNSLGRYNKHHATAFCPNFYSTRFTETTSFGFCMQTKRKLHIQKYLKLKKRLHAAFFFARDAQKIGFNCCHLSTLCMFAKTKINKHKIKRKYTEQTILFSL